MFLIITPPFLEYQFGGKGYGPCARIGIDVTADDLVSVNLVSGFRIVAGVLGESKKVLCAHAEGDVADGCNLLGNGIGNAYVLQAQEVGVFKPLGGTCRAGVPRVGDGCVFRVLLVVYLVPVGVIGLAGPHEQALAGDLGQLVVDGVQPLEAG